MRKVGSFFGFRYAGVVSIPAGPLRLPEAATAKDVFRVIADGFPQIVWIVGPDGATEYVNRAWTDYSGLAQSELEREIFMSVVHPDDRERVTDTQARARDTRSAFELELRIRRKDGNYRWFAARSDVVWNADGTVYGRFGAMTDIDDTKRMQAQFEEYRMLSETIPSFVWVSDADGKMLYANSRWLEFTGVPAEKMTRETWAAIVHPDDVEETGKRWIAAGKSGKPYEAEFRLKSRTGEYRWVLRNSVPLVDAEGKIAKWIGVTIDITEQKRLESELRSAIAIRDQFLAVCSHELKTPLTLMELHAESFRRKALRGNPEDLTPEMLGKYFERLSPHLKRLNHRINDMFDVSRIASGRLVLKLEEVDLVGIARAALENLAPQLELSGCDLTLNAPDALYCRCDPPRIEQVLTNLVENALKYAKGKPVSLRLLRDDAGAAVEVDDRGPGIAEADRARIFEKFERAAEGTGVSGLGLGLHIASEIVAAHGGTIEVRSRLGEGSTFAVRLPA